MALVVQVRMVDLHQPALWVIHWMELALAALNLLQVAGTLPSELLVSSLQHSLLVISHAVPSNLILVPILSLPFLPWESPASPARPSPLLLISPLQMLLPLISQYSIVPIFLLRPSQLLLHLASLAAPQRLPS